MGILFRPKEMGSTLQPSVVIASPGQDLGAFRWILNTKHEAKRRQGDSPSCVFFCKISSGNFNKSGRRMKGRKKKSFQWHDFPTMLRYYYQQELLFMMSPCNCLPRSGPGWVLERAITGAFRNEVLESSTRPSRSMLLSCAMAPYNLGP